MHINIYIYIYIYMHYIYYQPCSPVCNPPKYWLAIYQETLQLAQIKIKFFQECTYVTDKYWPHLNDFLLGQEIINLGPVSPEA